MKNNLKCPSDSYQFKKNLQGGNANFFLYDLLVGAKLNKTKHSSWTQVLNSLHNVPYVDQTSKEVNIYGDHHNLLVHLQVDRRQGDCLKVTQLVRACYQMDVREIKELGPGHAVIKMASNLGLYNTKTKGMQNMTQMQHYPHPIYSNQSFSASTFGSKSTYPYFVHSPTDDTICFFNFTNSVHFILFKLHLNHMNFAGKIMFYQNDRFLAFIEGAEGLMLGDFVIDNELIWCLTNV